MSDRDNSIRNLVKAKVLMSELKNETKSPALLQIEELEFWGLETDCLQYPENQDFIKTVKDRNPSITNEELVKEIKSWLSSQS